MANLLTYGKNAFKSILYVSVNEIKELNPVISSAIDNNKESTKLLYSSIKDFKSTKNKIKSAITSSEYYEFATDFLKNSVEDIKTGKFYNKERQDQAINTEFGFDEEEDVQFIDDEPTIAEVGEDITTAVGLSTVNAAEYVGEVTKANTNKLTDHIKNLGGQITNGFGALNSSITNLEKITSEAFKAHIDNSTKFYAHIDKAIEEQNSILREIRDYEKARTGQITVSKSSKRKSAYDFIDADGAIDVAAYMQMISENIKNEVHSWTDMFDMGGGGLKAISANPLELPLKVLINKLIPGVIKKASTSLNETLSGAVTTIFGKLRRSLSNSNGLLSGKLMEVLGLDQYGVSHSIKTTFNRGPIPWDGEAKKALTEVIPGYLANIEAMLSGKEASIFNYETGKYTTASKIKKDKNEMYDNYASGNQRDLMNDFNKYSKMFKMSKSDREEREKSMREFLLNMQQQEDLFDPAFMLEMAKATEIGQDSRSKRYQKLKAKEEKDILTRAERKRLQQYEDFGLSNLPEQLKDPVVIQWLEHLVNDPKANKNKIISFNSGMRRVNKNYNDYIERLGETGGGIFAVTANGKEMVEERNSGNLLDSVSNRISNILYTKDGNNYTIFDYLKEIRDNTSTDNVKSTTNTKDTRKVNNRNRKKNRSVKTHTTSGTKTNTSDDAAAAAASHYEDSSDWDGYVTPEEFAEMDEFERKTYLYNVQIHQQSTDWRENSEFEEELDKTSKKHHGLSGIIDFLKKPGEAVAHLINKADMRLYQALYGSTDGDGQYQGFMEMLGDKMRETFDKFNTWMSNHLTRFWDKFTENPFIKGILEKLGLKGVKEEGLMGTELGQNITSAKNKLKEDVTKQLFSGTIKKNKQLAQDHIDNVLKLDNTIIDAKHDGNGKTIYVKRNDGTLWKAVFDNKARKYNDSLIPVNRGSDTTRAHKVFGDTVETSNVDGQAARGLNYVPKTGLYALSRGEAIIPANKNPYYKGPRKSLKQQLKDEQWYINHGGNILGNYAEGTDNASTDEKISLLSTSIDKLNDGISTLTSWAKETGKSAKAKVKEKADKYQETSDAVDATEMVAGTLAQGLENAWNGTKTFLAEATGYNDNKDKYSRKYRGKGGKNLLSESWKDVKSSPGSLIIGGGIGALGAAITGIAGPLVGGLVGAAAGLIKDSDNVKELLFGELDDNGERRGNIFNKKISNAIEKYVPSMASHGGVGALLSLIPGIPGGPIAGLMVGSAIGFARKNDKLQEKLFGKELTDDLGNKYRDDSNALIKKKTIEHLKKALPNMSIGAIGGLIAGPFSLIPNIMLGSAVGYVTTTNKFKELMLGKEEVDENGNTVRKGGLAGTIKDKVVTPVVSAIKPLKKQLELGVKGFFNGIKNTFDKVITNYVGLPINRFLTEKVFSPIANVAKKVGKTLINPIGSVLTAPTRAIGAIGKHFKQKQIAQGNADYMTAGERLNYRKEVGLGKFSKKDRFYSFDYNIANMNTDDLADLKQQLSFGKTAADGAKNAELEARKRIADKINNSTMNYDHAKALNKLVQSGNYEKASEYIAKHASDILEADELRNYIIEEAAGIEEAKQFQKQIGMEKNGKISSNSLRGKLNAKLNKRFEGLNIKSQKDIDKLASMLDVEEAASKKEESEGEKAGNIVSDKLGETHKETMDSIRDINQTLINITHLLGGDNRVKDSLLKDINSGNFAGLSETSEEGQNLYKAINSGNISKAKEILEKLKKSNPDVDYSSFEDNINYLDTSLYSRKKNQIKKQMSHKTGFGHIFSSRNILSNEDIVTARIGQMQGASIDKVREFISFASGDRTEFNTLPKKQKEEYAEAINDISGQNFTAKDIETIDPHQVESWLSEAESNYTQATGIVSNANDSIKTGASKFFSKVGSVASNIIHTPGKILKKGAELLHSGKEKLEGIVGRTTNSVKKIIRDYPYDDGDFTYLSKNSRIKYNEEGHTVHQVLNNGTWVTDMQDPDTAALINQSEKDHSLLGLIQKGVNSVKDGITGFFDKLTHNGNGEERPWFRALKKVFGVVFKIGAIFTAFSAGSTIKKFWDKKGKPALLNWWAEGPAKTIAERAVNLYEKVKPLWDKFSERFTKVANVITKIGKFVVTLPEFLSSLWENRIKPGFSIVMSGLGDMYANGWEALKALGTKVTDTVIPWAVETLVEKIFNPKLWNKVISAVGTGIKNGLTGLFSGEDVKPNIEMDNQKEVGPLSGVTDWLSDVKSYSKEYWDQKFAGPGVLESIADKYNNWIPEGEYTEENTKGMWAGKEMFSSVVKNIFSEYNKRQNQVSSEDIINQKSGLDQMELLSNYDELSGSGSGLVKNRKLHTHGRGRATDVLGEFSNEQIQGLYTSYYTPSGCWNPSPSYKRKLGLQQLVPVYDEKTKKSTGQFVTLEEAIIDNLPINIDADTGMLINGKFVQGNSYLADAYGIDYVPGVDQSTDEKYNKIKSDVKGTAAVALWKSISNPYSQGGKILKGIGKAGEYTGKALSSTLGKIPFVGKPIKWGGKVLTAAGDATSIAGNVLEFNTKTLKNVVNNSPEELIKMVDNSMGKTVKSTIKANSKKQAKTAYKNLAKETLANANKNMMSQKTLQKSIKKGIIKEATSLEHIDEYTEIGFKIVNTLTDSTVFNWICKKLKKNPVVLADKAAGKASKVATKIGKFLSSKVSSTTFKTISGFVKKVTIILAVASAVYHLAYGWLNANTILGVIGEVSLFEKVIASLMEVLNDVFLNGLLDPEMLFDLIFIVYDLFDDGSGTGYFAKLKKRRQESQEILAAYNAEHGTDLDIEDYNQTVWDGATKLDLLYNDLRHIFDGGTSVVKTVGGVNTGAVTRGATTYDIFLDSNKSFTGFGSGLVRNKLAAKGSFTSQIGQYANMRYGNSTIGEAGCAPTTAMNVVNSLTNSHMGINEAANIAKNGGYINADGSTDIEYFGKALGTRGIGTSYYSNTNQLTNSLMSGKSAILMGRDVSNTSKAHSPFGSGSHYVLAKGMDSRGNVLVADPENNSERYYSANILNNVNAAVGINGRGSRINKVYNKLAARGTTSEYVSLFDAVKQVEEQQAAEADYAELMKSINDYNSYNKRVDTAGKTFYDNYLNSVYRGYDHVVPKNAEFMGYEGYSLANGESYKKKPYNDISTSYDVDLVLSEKNNKSDDHYTKLAKLYQPMFDYADTYYGLGKDEASGGLFDWLSRLGDEGKLDNNVDSQFINNAMVNVRDAARNHRIDRDQAAKEFATALKYMNELQSSKKIKNTTYDDLYNNYVQLYKGSINDIYAKPLKELDNIFKVPLSTAKSNLTDGKVAATRRYNKIKSIYHTYRDNILWGNNYTSYLSVNDANTYIQTSKPELEKALTALNSNIHKGELTRAQSAIMQQLTQYLQNGKITPDQFNEYRDIILSAITHDYATYRWNNIKDSIAGKNKFIYNDTQSNTVMTAKEKMDKAQKDGYKRTISEFAKQSAIMGSPINSKTIADAKAKIDKATTQKEAESIVQAFKTGIDSLELDPFGVNLLGAEQGISPSDVTDEMRYNPEYIIRQNLGCFSPITSTDDVSKFNKWFSSRTKDKDVDYKIFLEAASVSGLDPRYIASHWALETGWGTSEIWINKNNPFGIHAYDGNAYNQAYSYNSKAEGIVEGAKWIADHYYKNGQTCLYTMQYDPSGNGHNYATDDNSDGDGGWCMKIAKTMSSRELPKNTNIIYDDVVVDATNVQPSLGMAALQSENKGIIQGILEGFGDLFSALFPGIASYFGFGSDDGDVTSNTGSYSYLSYDDSNPYNGDSSIPWSSSFREGKTGLPIMNEREAIVREAQSKIGKVTYTWGGRDWDNNKLDCSGFVLQVFKRVMGVDIGGYSVSQLDNASNGNVTNLVNSNEVMPGDIVWFSGTNKDRPGETASHVGIISRYDTVNKKLYMIDCGSKGVTERGVSNCGGRVLGFGRVPTGSLTFAEYYNSNGKSLVYANNKNSLVYGNNKMNRLMLSASGSNLVKNRRLLKNGYGGRSIINALPLVPKNKKAKIFRNGQIASRLTDNADKIVNAALNMSEERMKLKNKKPYSYIWGGKKENFTPDKPNNITDHGGYGLDCSGFSDYIFTTVKNNPIGEGCAAQFDNSLNNRNNLTLINENDVMPGDLVYFADEAKDPNRPSHVGIITGQKNGKLYMVDCTHDTYDNKEGILHRPVEVCGDNVIGFARVADGQKVRSGLTGLSASGSKIHSSVARGYDLILKDAAKSAVGNKLKNNMTLGYSATRGNNTLSGSNKINDSTFTNNFNRKFVLPGGTKLTPKQLQIVKGAVMTSGKGSQGETGNTILQAKYMLSVIEALKVIAKNTALNNKFDTIIELIEKITSGKGSKASKNNESKSVDYSTALRLNGIEAVLKTIAGQQFGSGEGNLTLDSSFDKIITELEAIAAE